MTEFKIKKPLVLGGTGFIGLNIAQRLQETGHAVRITRRPSSLTFIPRKLKLPMIEASLDDEESLDRAMREADVVFCAAGHYPRYSVDQEAQLQYAVQGIRRALHAAQRAGVERFVYTSSVTTIGPAPAGRLADETSQWPSAPDSVYFTLKLAMEREVLRAGQDGLPVVVLCPTGCLGRYDVKAGTGFFIPALALGKLPYVVDGPLNVVGVEAAAQAHITAAVRGRLGARYILGSVNLLAGELLALAAARLGVARPPLKMAIPLAHYLNLRQEERCAAAGRGRPDVPVEFLDMLRFGQFYDCARAREELGWREEPLAQIIERAVAWFKKSGYLKKTPTG